MTPPTAHGGSEAISRGTFLKLAVIVLSALTLVGVVDVMGEGIPISEI